MKKKNQSFIQQIYCWYLDYGGGKEKTEISANMGLTFKLDEKDNKLSKRYIRWW